MPTISNWNGYHEAECAAILRPTDAEAIAATIRAARASGGRVRAIGGRHTFNRLALTDGVVLDLSALSQVLSADPSTGIVRVQGGMHLRDLVVALEARGLALPNLGAWTEQTIAGVISTATHGSCGRWQRDMMSAVVGVQAVDGAGALREWSARELGTLSLGMFGVITEVTLQCEPLYWVVKDKDVVDLDRAIERIPELLGAHDYVDLRWTGGVDQGVLGTWERAERPPGVIDRVLMESEGVRLGLLNRALDLIPFERTPARVNRALFEILGRAYVLGAETPPTVEVWHRGLTFNSHGHAARHDEVEIAVPMVRAIEALQRTRRRMNDDPSSAGIEVQIRFSPPSPWVLAPNYGHACAWIDFNIFDRPRARPIIEAMTQTLIELGGRPHWGKTIPDAAADLGRIYGDELRTFEEVRRGCDPDGVLLNGFYDRRIAPALAAC
ncbi:MAG: FAD-binding protein [Nannocystaceae bacterium]